MSGAEGAESNAVTCARVVVGELIAGGVRDAVLAPGSRSAPFAYVLAAADRSGELRLHVRIDERTAAYLALGLARATARPVPVVTTSGTAAANLHPAVLEASASGIPLIAITADRPAALRHSGANQTTDQLRLFGTAVRGFAALDDGWGEPGWRAEVARLVALASGTRSRRPGPVQVNVSLADPLVPTGPAGPLRPDGPLRPGQLRPDGRLARACPAPPLRLQPGRRTVVIAGDATPDLGRAAVRFATEAEVPLLAEPSSNARTRPALATGRILLGSPLAAQIERVVVFGRPTLSRPVSALLARAGVDLVVVSDVADWPDPGLRRPVVADAVELEPDGSDWARRWAAADLTLLDRINALLGGEVANQGTLPGPVVARLVRAAVGTHGALVVGSSNPIRDLDLAPVADDPAPVYANRGLAGIDGTLSTAVGIALGSGCPTHVLTGDLTFLHDLTGLVVGPDEPRPDLRIVVANDDGGSIFATLEHGRPAFAATYERVFGTPHHADLTGLAHSLGIAARRVRTAGELGAALANPPQGIELVEVPVDRSRRRALDQEITGLAATL